MDSLIDFLHLKDFLLEQENQENGNEETPDEGSSNAHAEQKPPIQDNKTVPNDSQESVVFVQNETEDITVLNSSQESLVLMEIETEVITISDTDGD